jgi:hypothetical protein
LRQNKRKLNKIYRTKTVKQKSACPLSDASVTESDGTVSKTVLQQAGLFFVQGTHYSNWNNAAVSFNNIVCNVYQYNYIKDHIIN